VSPLVPSCRSPRGAVRRLLEAEGYGTSRATARSPWNFVLGDGQGREVDVKDVAARPSYSSGAGASHGHVSRSTSATAPKRTMAISERRIIELKASSVFQYEVAERIT